MQGTGVFATREQVSKIATCGITLTLSPFAPHEDTAEITHGCALDAGLPDFSGCAFLQWVT